MKTIEIPPGLQTKFFVLSSGALNDLPELLKTAFPGKTPWIVADGNTWKVAGERAAAILKDAGLDCAESYIFPAEPKPHADFACSEILAGKMPENCVPVAVGSGVINDLTKCAAGLKEVPYCCVPTACSVDGYTSAGAALAVNGFKKTVKCPAPLAVCADIDVLVTAPADMLASGYADLFAKIPAGADWLLADAVGEEPIRNDVWQLIQGNIRKWVADKSDLLNIFHGLAATGYSMQMYLDSRPASGSEHLYSHIWEMEGLTFRGKEVSHGFKVGVGLLASTLLMEYVMNHTPEELRARMKPALSGEERIAEIDKLLNCGCYGSDPKETAMKKFVSGSAMEERRKMLLEKLPEIQTRFRKQLISFEETGKLLKDAGCPVRASEIGLSREQFLHGIRTSQLIRLRYTVVDYLYELGLLDDALTGLEVML